MEPFYQIGQGVSDFAIKMMDFALKIMDFALKIMDFVFKMMDFVLKMVVVAGRVRGRQRCTRCDRSAFENIMTNDSSLENDDSSMILQSINDDSSIETMMILQLLKGAAYYA